MSERVNYLESNEFKLLNLNVKAMEIPNLNDYRNASLERNVSDASGVKTAQEAANSLLGTLQITRDWRESASDYTKAAALERFGPSSVNAAEQVNKSSGHKYDFAGGRYSALEVADKFFSQSVLPGVDESTYKNDGLIDRSDINRAIDYLNKQNVQGDLKRLKTNLEEIRDNWEQLPKDLHGLVHVNGLGGVEIDPSKIFGQQY
jgi:hypothetical protein